MSIVCLLAIFIIGIVRRSRGRTIYRNRWETELEQIEEMSDLDEEYDKAESETKNCKVNTRSGK